MIVLLLVAAGAGLWLWRRREDAQGEAPGAGCAAYDAEIEALVERQYQVVSNLAYATDPARREALVAELVALEHEYNRRAIAPPEGCDFWTTRRPEE